MYKLFSVLGLIAFLVVTSVGGYLYKQKYDADVALERKMALQWAYDVSHANVPFRDFETQKKFQRFPDVAATFQEAVSEVLRQKIIELKQSTRYRAYDPVADIGEINELKRRMLLASCWSKGASQQDTLVIIADEMKRSEAEYSPLIEAHKRALIEAQEHTESVKADALAARNRNLAIEDAKQKQLDLEREEKKRKSIVDAEKYEAAERTRKEQDAILAEERAAIRARSAEIQIAADKKADEEKAAVERAKQDRREMLRKSSLNAFTLQDATTVYAVSFADFEDTYILKLENGSSLTLKKANVSNLIKADPKAAIALKELDGADEAVEKARVKADWAKKNPGAARRLERGFK